MKNANYDQSTTATGSNFRKLLEEVFQELEERQTYGYRIVALSQEYKLTNLAEVYKPESPAEDAIVSLEIMEAALKSWREGRRCAL